MAHFLATLFVRHPELRPMFPLALDEHRHRIFAALARCAWSSDRPESLDGWLAELAREHRKFGVQESHFRPFCDALLAALQAALRSAGDGPATAPAHAAWHGALDHIAAVMSGAVREGAAEPAWWLAEVTRHEQRAPGVAVLTLRPDEPLGYRAGQHVSVQVPRWPRVWREYSIANAPAPGGLLALHVRAVPCGLVSTVLVHQTAPGDTVVLGPARGGMTADAMGPHAGESGSSGGVACFAGGTGLAPVKAVVEELTARPAADLPAGGIRLFVGARHRAALYDAADLQRLARARPALTVIPVVSDDPTFDGLTGTLAQAAERHLPRDTSDVFISGPPDMVAATAKAAAARAPAARLHFDPPARLGRAPAGQMTAAPEGDAAAAPPAQPPRPQLVPWQPQG